MIGSRKPLISGPVGIDSVSPEGPQQTSGISASRGLLRLSLSVAPLSIAWLVASSAAFFTYLLSHSGLLSGSVMVAVAASGALVSLRIADRYGTQVTDAALAYFRDTHKPGHLTGVYLPLFVSITIAFGLQCGFAFFTPWGPRFVVAIGVATWAVTLMSSTFARYGVWRALESIGSPGVETAYATASHLILHIASMWATSMMVSSAWIESPGSSTFCWLVVFNLFSLGLVANKHLAGYRATSWSQKADADLVSSGTKTLVWPMLRSGAAVAVLLALAAACYAIPAGSIANHFVAGSTRIIGFLFIVAGLVLATLVTQRDLVTLARLDSFRGFFQSYYKGFEFVSRRWGMALWIVGVPLCLVAYQFLPWHPHPANPISSVFIGGAAAALAFCVLPSATGQQMVFWKLWRYVPSDSEGSQAPPDPGTGRFVAAFTASVFGALLIGLGMMSRPLSLLPLGVGDGLWFAWPGYFVQLGSLYYLRKSRYRIDLLSPGSRQPEGTNDSDLESPAVRKKIVEFLGYLYINERVDQIRGRLESHRVDSDEIREAAKLAKTHGLISADPFVESNDVMLWILPKGKDFWLTSVLEMDRTPSA